MGEGGGSIFLMYTIIVWASVLISAFIDNIPYVATMIPVIASIAGIGILRKAGYEVKNSDFFKIGIPFTMAAVIPAYICLWLVFGL